MGVGIGRLQSPDTGLFLIPLSKLTFLLPPTTGCKRDGVVEADR